MEKRTNAPVLLLATALLLSAFYTSVYAQAISTAPETVRSHNGNHSQPFIPMSIIGAALAVDVGLYDSNDTEVTHGELNSQDYWWTKYDSNMLELALKQHQPEGRIGLNLAVALRRLDDLTKKYPKHEEIKKWKARFEEIQSKINPDADRRASFGSECPWDEANFAQLWVNLHWIEFLVKQQDWGTAAPLMQNVQQNYKIMLAPDRMKNYPEELRKWVVESKPKADKFAALIKEKRGG